MNKLKLNLFKKLLSVALTSTFLLSFNIVPAQASDYYDGVNGVVNCENADEVSGDFTITANVVVSHSFCQGVAEIPVGVTSIGDSAFSSATFLTSVIIPSSVTSIGNSAFSLDPDLTSVTFLRTAAPTVGILPFSVVVGATANVPYNATGFGANGSTWNNLIVTYGSAPAEDSGSNDLTWVGAQSITCPAPNPWVKEQLDFFTNAKPVLITAENTVGKTITSGSYKALRSSGVVFDTVSTKVSTATETLPLYGCKDKLLSGKINQPIQFIAGGYTLQSDAHGYINTADLKWHDTNGVTLYTNTAAFMHTVKFTKTGKYVVVLTEQPDTSRGLIPTYGVRSIRFVINVN